MAQESGAAENSKQEVDIDELEVEILVIARNPNSLKQTAAFLNRRGWPTTVLSNVSKAIEYISENRPDFVMISFNHPSPSINRLDDLITQTFAATCIGFVESTDSLSNQKLTQVKMRNKVFGQPSGPNFQRSIRRLLGERFNVNTDEHKDKEKAEKEIGSITVRGGEKNGSDSGSEYAQEDQSDKTVVQEGSRSSKKEGSEEGQSANPFVLGHLPTSKSPDRSGIYESSVEGPMGASRANESEDHAELPDKDARKSGSRKKLKNLKGDPKGGDLALDRSGSPAQTSALGSSTQTKNANDLARDLKNSLLGESSKREQAAADFTSHVEIAAETALKKVVESTAPESPRLIGLINRVAVYPVDSPDTPGYLVLALESQIDEKTQPFLDSCSLVLQRVFGEMSIGGVLESGLTLDIPEVLFDDWVESQAQFNFRLEHQGSELGVAFFLAPKALPKLIGSEAGEMVTVGLDDISVLRPVNFKAYLHLKLNQRYYLYLRNGRELQPEQKARLKKHQVNEFFMKPIDLENLRIFLVTEYLVETIKKAKKAA